MLLSGREAKESILAESVVPRSLLALIFPTKPDLNCEDVAVPLDLSTMSVRELLGLWAGSLRELHTRGIVRTFNSPIGDIAEELVALHYGGTRGGFTQKTWDVQVGDEFLQVKALRRTNGRAGGNLSPIRSDGGYTAVVAVIFTEDLRVDSALRIPREVVNEMFPRTRMSTDGV